MSRIWYPETDAIVLEYWGKLSNEEIAERVNEYLGKIYTGKYKTWNITSEGGVRYAAHRLGIISDEEYEQTITDKIKAKHKIRQKLGYINLNVRAKVILRDKKCLRCGCTEDLTVDHIIPVSLGGTADMNNLQTLCRYCNSSKGTRVWDYRKHKRLKHKRNENHFHH